MARLRLRKTRIVFGPDGRPRWVRVVNWEVGVLAGLFMVALVLFGVWLRNGNKQGGYDENEIQGDRAN